MQLFNLSSAAEDVRVANVELLDLVKRLAAFADDVVRLPVDMIVNDVRVVDGPFRLIHLLSRLVVQGLPLLHVIDDVGLEVSGGGALAAILFLSLAILRLDNEGTFGLFVLTSHIRRGHA